MASRAENRSLMLEVLTFSTLFPNAEQPRKGVFVEQRLRKLIDSGSVRASVVAPVPWFPFRSTRFGAYGSNARVPRSEERHGIQVTHPRYPLIPKLGMTVAPMLMATAVRNHVRQLLADRPGTRAIDAHYFYPDGVAAARIGAALRLPFVITARGSDINLLARYRAPRAQIRWAARRAARLITVSQALKDRLVDLGIDGDKVTVLRNGVDLEVFRPVDRAEARARLAFRGTTLVSAGNLLELKGHQIAIEALPALPDVQLVIIGDGPMRDRLAQLARDLGVDDRVRLVGGIRHEEMPTYLGAADALVLASSREGMANVLLESLACGTPVIATRVGGNPEIVSERAAGVLMDRRDAAALVAAYKELTASPPTREETRGFAQRFSWEDTTRGQIAIFSALGRG